MTFDKLTYINRLKAAGFAEQQARAMADGLDQVLREEAATKSNSDVKEMRDELLAAMKANRIGFIKWFAMLLAGQAAVLAAVIFLGH